MRVTFERESGALPGYVTVGGRTPFVAIGIEDRVVISPASWPSRAAAAPGDPSQYAPIGRGMAAPMIVRPWDNLADVTGRSSVYGASARTGDLFRDAPVNDAAGGTVYFDSGSDVRRYENAYALYAAESADPPRDRYLTQLRIVAFDAMPMFGAIPDPGDEPYEQPLTVAELIDAFNEAQETRWGRGMSSALRGTLNGDGDWAKERLAFGFMIENGSNGVYRLWSRPWLATR